MQRWQIDDARSTTVPWKALSEFDINFYNFENWLFWIVFSLKKSDYYFSMSGVKSINKFSSLSHIFVDVGQWPPITNFLCDLVRWPQLETVSKIWAFYTNFKNHMHYAACTKFDVTKCRIAPHTILNKNQFILLTLLPPKFIKFKPMNHLIFWLFLVYHSRFAVRTDYFT